MFAKPPGAATSLAMNESSITEQMSRVERLRARAKLYRRLADTLYDPNVIAVVLAFASECDAQAGALMGNEVINVAGKELS